MERKELDNQKGCFSSSTNHDPNTQKTYIYNKKTNSSKRRQTEDGKRKTKRKKNKFSVSTTKPTKIKPTQMKKSDF